MGGGEGVSGPFEQNEFMMPGSADSDKLIPGQQLGGNSVENDREVTLSSCLLDFVNMWVLGIKVLFKAIVGSIMTCLSRPPTR